jgi:hypothetical protein
MYKDPDYMQKWRAVHPGYSSQRNHIRGLYQPLGQNKESGNYLGVHVSERLLAGVFDHVERMPYGNPGYDFVCGKGKKIDVKSACRYKPKQGPDRWGFHVKCNPKCDAFLLIAFNNRQDITPEHVWLIPAKLINHLTGFCISDSKKSLSQWTIYEKELDKVNECCNRMKAGDIYVNGTKVYTGL